MPRTQLLSGEYLACYLIRTLGLSHSVGRTLWKQLSGSWKVKRLLEHFNRAIHYIALGHSLINPPVDQNGAGSQYFAELCENTTSVSLSFWERQLDTTAILLHKYTLSEPALDDPPRFACGILSDYSPVYEEKKYAPSLSNDRGRSVLKSAKRKAAWLQILNSLSCVLTREGWVRGGSSMKNIGEPHFVWDSDPIRFAVADYHTFSFIEPATPDYHGVKMWLTSGQVVRHRMISVRMEESKLVGDKLEIVARRCCLLPESMDFVRVVEFFVIVLSPHKRENRRSYLKCAMKMFKTNTSSDLVWKTW